MDRRTSTTLLLALALACASFGPVRPEPARRLPAVSAAPAPDGDAELARVLARLEDSPTPLVGEELEQVAETIVEEARRLDFEASLVLALIEVESQFDAFAVSPVGAVGLMQVMPATGKALAKDLGIEWRGLRTLFDPVHNLRIGLAYLDRLRERFDDLPTALAAYNRGPTAIGRRVRGGGTIPVGYAERVMSAYDRIDREPMTSS